MNIMLSEYNVLTINVLYFCFSITENYNFAQKEKKHISKMKSKIPFLPKF